MADVLIIGAGLAGLSCALELQKRGITFQILDAADAVGGRVRTDVVNGFRFDRGFQVMLTAYPEMRRILNYRELRLQHFEAGALVWYGGKWHHLADPRRVPNAIPRTIVSPIGSLRDKLTVAKTSLRLMGKAQEKIFAEPEKSTLDALRDEGYSREMIDRFFRPFLGGIFLERELRTSSRKFEFVFRMFTEGFASLPAEGMQAIPEQMARQLPVDSIRLNARVASLEPGSVRLEDGEVVSARNIVVATDALSCSQLLPQVAPVAALSTQCLYFAAPSAPTERPILMLNGENEGPINNLTVLSNVARSYAPPNTALISVSVPGAVQFEERLLERAVRTQLDKWFGEQTRTWRMLRAYKVWNALPQQFAGEGGLQVKPPRIAEGIYAAGDHLDSASLNGAVASGFRAAGAIAEDLRGSANAKTGKAS